MNPKLQAINELIDLCDKMLLYIQQNGDIKPNNELYSAYKYKVNSFCKEKKIDKMEYAPYVVLDKFYFSGTLYSVNMSEVSMIRDTLVTIKHSLFKDCYEQIFISHRESDKEQVAEFINLLHAIGVPRPTDNNPENIIFCTSHPEGCIKNGEKNLESIRNMFNSNKHIFYILWYTDDYFKSPACLNEAGAIWIMNKKYQQILMPDFDSDKINGLLDKQSVWFKANDKSQLNNFMEDMQEMFSLPQIVLNSWELERDKFINKINEFTN